MEAMQPQINDPTFKPQSLHQQPQLTSLQHTRSACWWKLRETMSPATALGQYSLLSCRS